MDKFKKFFPGRVEKIDVPIDSGHLIEGEIKTSQDLEDLYKEIECSADEYSDEDFTSQLSSKEQENHDYWEAMDKSQEKAYRNAGILTNAYAENIAAEEDWDMTGMDDIDLRFILGKKGWESSPEVDTGVAPTIENENRHTPREKLKINDLERQQRLEALYQEVRENPRPAKAPTNLPAETEGVTEFEKKEKDTTELDRFKLMKEALVYQRLIKENPDLNTARPMRGTQPLSQEEINAEIDRIKIKMEEDEGSVTKLERNFYKQCKAWNWSQKEIEKYKREGSIHGGIAEMSPDEIQQLQDEYFDFKNNNPEQFAKRNLEFVGEKKVEEGEWKKSEFTWKPEVHQGRTQWFCKRGTIKYITSIDPTSIAPVGQPAEFFYVEGKAFPLHNGDTLQFINIRIPFVDQGSKMGNKKVSVS